MISVSITFELPAFLNFDLVHSGFHLPVILFHKEAQQPMQSSTLTRYQSMRCSWRLQQDTGLVFWLIVTYKKICLKFKALALLIVWYVLHYTVLIGLQFSEQFCTKQGWLFKTFQCCIESYAFRRFRTQNKRASREGSKRILSCIKISSNEWTSVLRCFMYYLVAPI